MKCEHCKKSIDGSFEVMGNKNYCLLCYPEVRETEDQRIALVAFIIDTYKIPKPTGFMFGQMKKLKEKYTYKNMRLTLNYAFNVIGLKPDPKFGLTIINYYHDDMIEYYKRLLAKSKKNEGVEYKKKSVKITAQDKNYKDNKLFDMSKFEGE